MKVLNFARSTPSRKTTPIESLLFSWSLSPSRHSKTVDVVESISRAPVSSKTDPCASTYDGLSFARPAPFCKTTPVVSLLFSWRLFPSRHSKKIDLVESISTAPISLKTDPGASIYEGCTFGTFLQNYSNCIFVVFVEPFPFSTF